jgi:hypothetical protein
MYKWQPIYPRLHHRNCRLVHQNIYSALQYIFLFFINEWYFIYSVIDTFTGSNQPQLTQFNQRSQGADPSLYARQTTQNLQSAVENPTSRYYSRFHEEMNNGK